MGRGGPLIVALFVALLGGRAEAAPPAVLVLPAGEPTAEWSEPAELGGFYVGAAGSGARVVVTADSSGWHLRATDPSGVVRQATVLPPRDAQAREDLVWLAKSLLTPVGTSAWGAMPVVASPAAALGPAPGSPPPAPAPAQPPTPKPTRVASPAVPPAPRAPTPPAPAAAAPVARSAVSPAPADAGAVWPPPAPPLPVQPYAKAVPVVGPAPDAVPALAPAADPATAPTAASVTEPQPPAVSPSATVARKPVTGGIYAGIGGDLAYRKDIGVAAALSVDVAGELTWLRVGVSGHWQPSVALSDLGAERATSELRLAGDIGWHGVGRVRPALLGEAGVSFRSFTQGNLVVDRVPTPNLGVKASLGWAVRPGVVIEPWLSASADLGRVELQVEGSSKTAAVGGATGRAGVTIFAHFGP